MPPELTSTFVPTPMTQEQWNNTYWFNTLQMVTVINPGWYKGPDGKNDPVSADYPFMVEGRHFIIRAGQQEEFPGVIANVYLDQMSKILAQNDDKLGFMGDPALMKLYYDKLIVDVKDLAPRYDPTPAYLRDMDPRLRADAPDETPPWESHMERAREVNPTPPTLPTTPSVSPDNIPEPTKTEEPTEREFEYETNKYRMVTDKNGHKHFYKNGIMISNAEYNRVASLL